jgi:lysophospholipase L1-like esterase
MIITVLGDSSSSGIGLGQDCYPAKLVGILRDELDIHVLNCAVPGFTSADASRFFHAVASERPLDYLIIYLGNNEGAVGPRKGYYSAFKARVADRFSRQPERQFRPVLSPPRFRFTYEVQAQTATTTPAEFRDNLRSIVRRATKKGARVIILNPVANRFFPCGMGATNSTYFCYLDHLDRIGGEVVNDPIDEGSGALAAGLRCFIAGQWDEAIGIWTPQAARQNVAGFIARHNIACARARRGDDTSESQLRALLGEYESYDSTVLYNVAMLRRCQGDREAADQLLDAAYEKDTSIYRVRRKYREVIEGFASVNGVRVLDLAPILKSCHFVDYCHPTGEGHDEIARAVAALIRSDRPPRHRSEGSWYGVSLPTPNYVHQPGQTLLDYYCIDWPIAQDRIAAAIAAFGRADAAADAGENADEIDRCVANFFRANGQHPIFTADLDLSGAWMPRSHEILSFPEQFLYRVLYNYSVAFEVDGLAGRLSAAALLEPVRFSSAAYRQIIMRGTDDDLTAELDVTRAYFDAIVNKIGHQLASADLIYRVTIGPRLRTVLTWFTREAFRYGTQSRMSMLYARWDIERIVEGLIVAIVIAARRGDDRALGRLDGLLRHVLSLLQVHERHARRYHRDSASFSVGEYETDLADAERAIKAHASFEAA